MKGTGVWRVSSVFSLGLAILLALSPVAFGQQYPSRPISLILPAAVGVPADLLSRIFAEHLRQKLGVPVIVENVTGGQGLIGTQRVMNSRSDGYTFLIAPAGLVTTPHVVSNAGYKASDFIPIAALAQVPYVLFASSSVTATDIPSFISYLKSNSKDVNSGLLTTSYLSTLLSRKIGALAGVELTEIGYRGSSDMIKALITNDIQFMATAHSVAAPYLESGKIKAIGALADDRNGNLPNVATFKEKGYPSVKLIIWIALFARSDSPPDVLAVARRAANEVVKDASFQKVIGSTGMDPWPIAVEDLPAYIDSEVKEFVDDAKRYKLNP